MLHLEGVSLQLKVLPIFDKIAGILQKIHQVKEHLDFV